jgi:asparagine synthase (glutamine-hydrolysing)
MCGICGILHLAPPARAGVEAMMTQLGHRGPDGQGVHSRHPVTFGHRRLSIIDLATGRQPMSNEDGAVWVTYNGELYNFRELRAQLRAAGHRFRTESDTEVIVHAWEEWGVACVERFRGMFAFAIVDYRRGELFVARDHLGIKPLYYFHSPRAFVFASELQALRKHEDFSDEIDLDAIDNYLTLFYIPPPRTIYKNVYKLPPGHRMAVTFDGKIRGPEQYWVPNFSPQPNMSFAEWGDRFDAALRDSVRAHLVADVPFGAFLSGGLDSTSVVAVMAENLSRVRTFSIGFNEDDYNELRFARKAAQVLGTDHFEEIVSPNSVVILPDLVRHYGEPFGDSSAVATYYVARLARTQVPMVLTGDGGDEFFLGYESYVGWLDAVSRFRSVQAGWKRRLHSLLAYAVPQKFSAPTPLRPPGMRDWLKKMTSFNSRRRSQLWRPEFSHIIDKPISEIEQIGREALQVPLEQFGQYFDIKTYLPHDILTKVDVATMMHGIEARTPLCDVRMAEFATTIPWQINLRRGHAEVCSGKHLLKRFLSRYFDQEFLNRKKAGFTLPLKHWFSKDGALRGELEQRFFSSTARLHRYLRPAAIEQVIVEHDRTQEREQGLWQLLFLENWLEHVHDPAAGICQAASHATDHSAERIEA